MLSCLTLAWYQQEYEGDASGQCMPPEFPVRYDVAARRLMHRSGAPLTEALANLVIVIWMRCFVDSGLWTAHLSHLHSSQLRDERTAVAKLDDLISHLAGGGQARGPDEAPFEISLAQASAAYESGTMPTRQ